MTYMNKKAKEAMEICELNKELSIKLYEIKDSLPIGEALNLEIMDWWVREMLKSNIRY